MNRRTVAHRRASSQPGSVVILVLFVCLSVALVIQSVTSVALCAERGLAEEEMGRRGLAARDEGLALLSATAVTAWEVLDWTDLPGGGESAAQGPTAVAGRLSHQGTSGWVMEATAKQAATLPTLTCSAWVERGRDGVDLPLAALVAGGLEGDAGRRAAWVEFDEDVDGDDPSSAGLAPEAASPTGAGSTAEVLVMEAPSAPLLGAGCTLGPLDEAWRLDPGWQLLGSQGDDVGPAVVALSGRAGQSLRLADELDRRALKHGPFEPLPGEPAGRSADSPLLVLVTGGAGLDARGLGDLYGVVVVDRGSLLLEGTTLHGALFVSGTVALGVGGRLLYNPAVLRWAADRSLCRTRLVPGSRSEGTE